MSRTGLKARDGQRFRVRAYVERFGAKRGFRGSVEQTVLLRNVCDTETGAMLCDHVWFSAGKWSADLVPGCCVEFNGRVADYEKGYQGCRDVDKPPGRDWKLMRPTKIVVVSRPPAPRSSRWDITLPPGER